MKQKIYKYANALNTQDSNYNPYVKGHNLTLSQAEGYSCTMHDAASGSRISN